MAKARTRKPIEPAAAASPYHAWSWYANGPLRGAGIARERQWIYAWDDANTIYLLDLSGELIAEHRAPMDLIAVAGADTGERFAAVSRMGQFWFLDRNLKPRFETRLPADPTGLAIDPHGDYAIIAGQSGRTMVYNSAGKRVSEIETVQPLRHLAFAPATGAIMAAAEHGMVVCLDYKSGVVWQTENWSNIGGLAVDGSGDVLLLACFGHGIIRVNGDGAREGAYRYDHSPSHVAVDFEGTTILATSLEKYLTQLSFSGSIQGDRALGAKPVSLSMDSLGRYAVIAFDDGELRTVLIPGVFQKKDAGDVAVKRGGGQSVVSEPEPAWEKRVTDGEDELASATIEPVPTTGCIALLTDKKTLRIFDETGERIHESLPITGTGSSIVVGGRWLAAASDRNILGYDPETKRSVRGNFQTIEISNLELMDKFGEALLIESCEYVRRIRFPDQELWKRRMNYRVESAALLDSGHVAMVLEDRNLIVLDPAGEPAGKYRPKPVEAIQIVGLGKGWVTTSRDSALVRGHDLDGSVLWTLDLPWPPWSARRVGHMVLITSNEGYSALVDLEGNLLDENREPREQARYFLFQDGSVGRLFVTGSTLIATTFGGRLLWRRTDEHRIGERAAGSAGVWAFLGRQLAFFPWEK